MYHFLSHNAPFCNTCTHFHDKMVHFRIHVFDEWIVGFVRWALSAPHYSDVIMGVMASQITSLTIVYSTVCSGEGSKKTSKLRITGLCAGNSPVTGEFPAQMASNAENVSIWWCEHLIPCEAAYSLWSLLSAAQAIIGLGLLLIRHSAISWTNAEFHHLNCRE